MKLSEKGLEKVKSYIKEAVEAKDFNRCVKIAENLRVLGYRYYEIADLVEETTGLSMAEWDSFLEEGEFDDS